MTRKRFNKTQLAAQVSLVLSTLFATQVSGAEAVAVDDDIEVIQVAGIRGSLIKSMDVKKESSGVVDAISAEDIGKFPDTNLAESLQRITGVSIERSDGEGSRVTIRGFGASENLVLLNGRQMPTPTRSFDFSDLASESVSSVEVYKTGRASIATGGMGGTINIITPRPLSTKGEKASFGVKGVRDLSSTGDSWTPEVSGIYSNTFLDDTFGFAITGSYQRRDSSNNNATINSGWKSFISGQEEGADGSIPDQDPEGATLNKPAEGVTYAVPQNIVYQFNETSRTRTNGQIVLEYQPIDSLKARLDYTVSQVENDREITDVSAWFSRDYRYSTIIWSEPNEDNVAFPLQYQDTNNYKYAKVGEGEGDGINSGRGISGTKNTNKSLGLNLQYDVNDNLKVELDYHDGSAEHEPNSPYGSWGTLGVISKNKIRNTVDFTQDMPVLSIEYPDGVNGFEPEDIIGAGSNFGSNWEKSELTQAQAKAAYTFDDGVIESVQVGLSKVKVKNRSAYASASRATWAGVGTPEDWDDSWFTKKSLGAEFNKLEGHKDPDLLANYMDWDFKTIADFTAANFYLEDPEAWPCGPTFCGGTDPHTDRITEEDIFAAYVQFNLAFDIGDMPATLVTGLRYEETDVFSSAKVPTYDSIHWIATNELVLQQTGESEFTSETGSYDNLLPSLDLSVEVVDDVMARFSYSKTISRPGYGSMQGGKSLGRQLNNTQEGSGSRGNPGLLPLESNNFDLSLEWYYGEGSYIAAGYFRKEVDNYISNTVIRENAFGLTNPAQGARADEARASGIDANDRVGIRDYIEDNFISRDDVYLNASGNVVIEGADDDRLAEFLITIPVNALDTWVDGIEFAVQHVFGESGFGVSANATIVNNERSYDDASVESQFVLNGASDTANLVGFYENEDFTVRVAYNWRDKFLAYVGNNGGVDFPVYTEAYGQVDVNMSYNVTEKLQLFAEGINVTDGYQRQHSRHEGMLVNIRQMAPRYNLGMRYTF